MRYVTFAAVLVIALAMPMAAQTLEAQLQKAIQTETVTGDLKAAIEQYRRIARTAGPANRRIAAQALVRMAECHRRLGDAEATKIYERILREYSDQREAAAEARTRLAGMRTPPAPRGPVSQIARQIWTGPDADPMGAPSADGRFLTYTNWMTGDLGLRDLTTGQNRHLTSTGGWEKSGDYAEFSVPSPDGTQVAYSWFKDSRLNVTKFNFYDLRLIGTGPDPGKPRVLYQAEDLGWVSPGAWTPDGQHLVINRHREKHGADLAVLSIKTGAVRTLRSQGGTVAAQRISVSPDGRFVAYDMPASHLRSARDIVVTPINGSSHTVIAANPANDTMPLFSPDGSTLLFLSDRGGSNGLWTVAMRDGKPEGAPRLLKPDLGLFYPLGFTRDGALYYFSGGDRINTYIVPVDATLAAAGEAVMVTDRFQNHNMSAAWSPDGQSLAFYAFQGLRENQGASLVVRNTVSGDEREFPLKVQPMRNGSAVRWFPDGRSLLVSGRKPDGPGLVFARLDLSSGKETAMLTAEQLGPATYSAAISADGRSIFHISAEDQMSTRVLRRFDLDTGASTALLEGSIHAIALSADGRELAYLAAESVNARVVNIGILPLAGGERRIVFSATWLDASRFNALSWTPDNKHILFVRSDDARGTGVWRVSAAGGAAQKIGVSAKGQIKHPYLHPDGTRLVYSVRETSDASVWVLENFLPAPAAKPAARK